MRRSGSRAPTPALITTRGTALADQAGQSTKTSMPVFGKHVTPKCAFSNKRLCGPRPQRHRIAPVPRYYFGAAVGLVLAILAVLAFYSGTRMSQWLEEANQGRYREKWNRRDCR